MFLIGPKKSGKTTIGRAVSERTNLKFVNYRDFIKTSDLKRKDEET